MRPTALLQVHVRKTILQNGNDYPIANRQQEAGIPMPLEIITVTGHNRPLHLLQRDSLMVPKVVLTLLEHNPCHNTYQGDLCQANLSVFHQKDISAKDIRLFYLLYRLHIYVQLFLKHNP